MSAQKLKLARKLTQAKYREKTGLFLAEGRTLAAEAIEYGDVLFAVVSEGVAFCADILTITVDEKTFSAISDTQNPQGIICVCRARSWDISGAEKIFYCDRVSDPGNLGTIIRTAEAAGLDAVVTGGGCADFLNPKVVRASMGSIFRLPVAEHPIEKFADFDIIAAAPGAEESVFEAKYAKKTVIVLGNEANGVSDEVLSHCNRRIKIPMRGKAESLNVAAAAAVIAFSLGTSE